MSQTTFRAAIVGATGYGGAEVVRLLSTHPNVDVTVVTSARNPGKSLRSECPWLDSDLILSAFEPETLDVDVVFLAQEAGFAMLHAGALSQRMRVIDLSADFRLTDAAIYEKFYGIPQSAPDVKAVYGLPELVPHEEIAASRVVANPGCYPTTTLLGLMPIVRAGLVNGTPIVDAKSGVSGAGRSKKDTSYLFSELDGSFKAYGVKGHRHTPEIEQMVGRPVRFTPHLLPIPRGLHATIHAPLVKEVDVLGLLREFYAGAKFVRVVDTPPTTKQVVGSNRCDIWGTYDANTGYAVICSALDNLVKGAAGEAIQSMNLMLGLPEETGLPLNGIWP